MILALFIFVGLMMGSMIFTYIVSSVLDSDKIYTEPAMDAVIQTNLALLTSSTIDLTGDIASIVVGKTMLFLSNLPGQALNIARFGVILGLAILFHETYIYFLQGGDTLFRTLLGPFFQDVLFSILQLVRLIYDAIVPLYNYYSTIFGQITSGSIAIAIRCDLSTVIQTLRLIIITFISLFKSVSDFASGNTLYNNVMVNEWNITQTLVNSQMIISSQQKIASCICDGLTDVFDLFFVVVNTPHLPRALNHLFNIPISLIQEIIQIMPPYSKMPLFTRLVYHVGSAGLEIATYADTVGVALFQKIIQLFIPEFYLKGAPEQFILATQARLYLAIIEAAHVIYRTAIHIIVPLPKFIGNPDYMRKAMDFEKALLHLELWNFGTNNFAHWVGMLTSKMIVGVFTGKGIKALEGVPEHVSLDCREISRKGYVKGPCAAYFSILIPLNYAYLANKLIGEVLWKSLFFQEQNLWRTFQRYDGMIQPRETSYSCEHRRDNMQWDVTRGVCRCERPKGNFPLLITEENPFGDNQLYDPYCGQPTLQANIWDPTIMAFRQALEGFLLDHYFFPIRIMYAEMIEFQRLIVRTILALPDIVMGNYFDIPLNCGWGTGDYTICNIKRHERNKINYCTEENGPGCTCNPSLPLEYNSTCQCIFYFPDAEQEVTQKAFRNDLLTNWYNAQHHWCGTYHFENYFSLADELAYRIDDVVSQFAPAYNSENNDYCESKSYKMLATDILQYTAREWNNDLLGNVSGVKYSYVRDSCQLYGSYDIICGASMTLRTGVFLVTQQLRGMVMTAVSFLALDVQNIKIDLSERLCDLQRAAAGASAAVAAFFPVGIVGEGVQQGMARMAYSVLDIVIVILQFYNSFLLWFNDVIRGAIEGRSAEEATFQLITSNLNLWTHWLRRVFQAFGTFMNGIHNGAGTFFFTIDNILRIFQNILSQAVLELFALIGKVFAGIIELFSAGGVIDNFFTDLFLLLSKFFDMVAREMSKFWSLIEKALEPLMKVIRGIGGAFKSICQTIESAICAISFGASCDIGCSRMRSSGIHHAFHASPDTPLHIAESIDWDGESRCDLMIHRYKNHTWNQLRPLEQIEISECLEQRYIAVKIAEDLDLPIPHDLLYNWKRKYQMGYDVGHAVMLYIQHVFGGLTSSQMMQKMRQDHVNLHLYLPILNRMRGFASSTFTMKNVDYVIHSAFKEFPNVEHGDTAISNMYRLYIHGSTFAREAYPHVIQLGDHYKVMTSAIKLQKLTHYSPVKHMEHLRSQWANIPKMFHHFTDKNPSPHKLKARQFVSPILGAAGLNADIRPCHEQEGTYVCINCVIVDNLLNTAIKEGIRMADYYENTYVEVVVPSFINYFEKQERRAKAYREDMASLLEEAAQKAIANLTTDAGTTLRSRRRFFSNTTEALSNEKLAQKDWEYLFENWAIRNDKSIVDVLMAFLSTVDDSYVPFFGYGFGYLITTPFIEACPMETIYCTRSTTQERLEYISRQFLYQLFFFAGAYGAQVYTNLPIFTQVSVFPVNYVIIVGIYMYTVYNYYYTCLPNIPNCLVDDIFAWLHDVAYPQCFCQYFPGLAESCDPELCFLASKSTVFTNCSTAVPLSSNSEMGYLWSPIFWVRKEFPDNFMYLYKTAPFSWVLRNFDGIKDIAVRLQDNVPITLAEEDCLGLRYTDLVVVLVGLYLASFFLSILLPIIAKVFGHGIKMVIILLNTIFAFGVATEVATVTGISNTYKD